jgi:hypothetical protein
MAARPPILKYCENGSICGLVNCIGIKVNEGFSMYSAGLYVYV